MPGCGVVDINIKAFGGQRNLLKLRAFLIALGGGSLSLVLRLLGVFGHAFNRLLFLVTGAETESQEERDAQQSFIAETMDHSIKDNRGNVALGSNYRCR